MTTTQLDALAWKLRTHALARGGVDDYEAANVLRPLNAGAVAVVVDHAFALGLLIRVRRVEVIEGEFAGRWVYMPWDGGARP